MAGPLIDWRKATFVGAIAGGIFWGLAAGAILASKASAAATTAICITAVVVMVVGAIMFRRSVSPSKRAFGIGLILAPLTGVTPVLVVWLPGLLTHAIS